MGSNSTGPAPSAAFLKPSLPAIWKAISFEGLGDYRAAIAVYHELIGKFSKDDRSSASLLRLAALFLRVGDMKTARITLQKLIADFPKSSAADLARERLKHISKSTK